MLSVLLASKIWKTQLHWIEFFPRSSQLMENIVVKNLFLFLPLFQFWNGVLVFIFLGVVVKVLFGLGLFLFLIYFLFFYFFLLGEARFRPWFGCFGDCDWWTWIYIWSDLLEFLMHAKQIWRRECYCVWTVANEWEMLQFFLFFPHFIGQVYISFCC